MIKRYEQCDRMSQIIVHNNIFETAGQVGLDPNSNIKVQTKDALNEIDRLLKLINVNKSNITRIQIWLSNINDFDDMNEIYDDWIKDYSKPVRACVESKIAQGYLVEIQAFGILS